MNTILRAEQLAVGYDETPLIHDISIRLQPGHVLSLIGPNGAGKSTILKTLTRSLKKIAGTVYVGEELLESLPSRELARRMSVVLTQRLRTEMMTCRDVVATGRYPYTGTLGILSAEDRRIVEETMCLVHVDMLADRDFACISDGQRQRVLLARALCQQPQIIVLDEPTSFLDIRYKLELLSTLRRMAQDRGIAVIMSLHELDLAQRVSDEIICVSGDHVGCYGTPDEVFSEEQIRSLYGVTTGSYNALFGSLELPAPEGKPEVFVLAGGGSGIPVFRNLQKRCIPFVTGVLHENDVDCQVARVLAARVITEKSFCPVSAERLAEAAEQLAGCRVLLSCVREFGPGNERNRELLSLAAEKGIQIAETLEEIRL